MLDHAEIKTLHDKAYQFGYDTRLKAADDYLFAWISQWDDTYLQGSDLAYRGEFNILRKAIRQIITDLNLNPVQVDFDPVDGTDDSGADLMDGMYRADMRNNASQEAKENASQEAVVGGVGAWELRTEWKTNRIGDERQVIKRYPLYEANNCVMWDPNAKLKDKSDSDYVSCLVSYSEDGYNDLYLEFTGEEPMHGPLSMAEPEKSYVFPWVSEDKRYYVSRFFHREKRKVKYLTFEDAFGARREISEKDLADYEDDLSERGFDYVSEREVERYVVTRYIVDGYQIIDTAEIPGEHIPVVPQYGERTYVEGQEHYEGIVRLAKDPQRLRNFQLSYLADIVSRSPREKPIFTAEQIQGFEDMYELNGSDNNYPYLKQRLLDTNGEPLPGGPVGYIKAPDVPPALMQSIGESRAAVDDVASPGLPQDITDTDLSGKAVQALQKRLDMQSYIYQHNHKHAMRRDGEIYASMARDIFDTEQEVTIVKIDGSKSREMINKPEMDYDRMERVIKNDVTSMIFDVYADIGPAFESVKAQNKEELKELINGLPPGTPEHAMLLQKYLMMIDGQGFEDVRDYAKRQLMLMGVKEPETPEDEQWLMQQQQAQEGQVDPMLLEGQARMMEGQAAIQNEINDANKIMVDQFNAETKRQEVMIKAEEAGVKINNTRADTVGKMIDNRMKLRQPVNAA
ncbi:hypothetical protein KAR91_53700 [Candidatus Pacearchaeota archaeon]|nr:hypothetical protein [Candidatus Pacearchaeota archaeon]